MQTPDRFPELAGLIISEVLTIRCVDFYSMPVKQTLPKSADALGFIASGAKYECPYNVIYTTAVSGDLLSGIVLKHAVSLPQVCMHVYKYQQP